MTTDIAKINTYHCFSCTAKQAPCIIHSAQPPRAHELERNSAKSQSNVLHCANCFSTTTPLWRRDPQGRTICNACGLYYKLNKVHRPACLKQDVIRRRRRTSKHMKSLTIIPVQMNQPAQIYATHPLHYHQRQQPYPNYYNHIPQQYQSNHLVSHFNQNSERFPRPEHNTMQYQVPSMYVGRSRCNSLPAPPSVPSLRSSTHSSPAYTSTSTFTSPPLENYSTFLTPPASTPYNEPASRCKLPSISELLPELIRPKGRLNL